jgi:hypothetical protein
MREVEVYTGMIDACCRRIYACVPSHFVYSAPVANIIFRPGGTCEPTSRCNGFAAAMSIHSVSSSLYPSIPDEACMPSPFNMYVTG